MAITAPTISLATTGTDPKVTTKEELEAEVNGALDTLTDDINAEFTGLVIGDISDVTATGEAVATAANAAAARSAISAAAAGHTHTTTDITDMTATGVAVATATDAEEARTALDVPSNDDLDMKADRGVTLVPGGRAVQIDAANQITRIIRGGPNGGFDEIPDRAYLDRFDAPEWIPETLAILSAGQSNGVAAVVEQEAVSPFTARGRPFTRRTATGVFMPNQLGMHDVSAITDELTDALSDPYETYGPISAFVPADERVNPKAGPKTMWSFLVPAAETFLKLRSTKKPEVVVCAIGNGSQPLVQPSGSPRVGLHLDSVGAKTAFYNRAVHVATRLIEVAAERGKPLRNMFITFDWGESVYGADPGFAGTQAEMETYRDQIDAYFDDLKTDILAVDSSVNVVFFIQQPAGNTTRGNYPVRLAADAVAAIRTDTRVVGCGFGDLFDPVHRTEDHKALVGTRYGYAMEAELRERMWTMPNITIARSGTTITLTSDQPLRELPWYSTGAALKGFTLSGASVIESVDLVAGRQIVIETDTSAAGQYLALGYRDTITGDNTITTPTTLDDPPAYPRAFHPFALARRTCPSLVLPGEEAPIWITSRYWEVPA